MHTPCEQVGGHLFDHIAPFGVVAGRAGDALVVAGRRGGFGRQPLWHEAWGQARLVTGDVNINRLLISLIYSI